MPDVDVNNSGSLVLLRPMTPAASGWIGENIPEDATWFGGALVVEWCYADDVIAGMEDAGLVVQ